MDAFENGKNFFNRSLGRALQDQAEITEGMEAVGPMKVRIGEETIGAAMVLRPGVKKMDQVIIMAIPGKETHINLSVMSVNGSTQMRNASSYEVVKKAIELMDELNN